MMITRAILLSVFLFSFSEISFASTNAEVEKATELLRSLCLAGSGYTVEIEGNGTLKIFKKSMDGTIKFSKKELNGVVDVSNNERKKELDSIRECIKPSIEKIIDAALSIDHKKPKVKKDISDNFLYEDFSSIEEGLAPKNWIVGENMLVEVKEGKHIFVSNTKKQDNKITITDISFPENFIINIKAKIGNNGKMIVKLSNNIFMFNAYYQSKMIYEINKSKKEIKETFVGQKAIFTIRKEGSVFKIFINGIKKSVARISGFEKAEALEINFNNASYGFEIYEVEGKKYIPSKK